MDYFLDYFNESYYPLLKRQLLFRDLREDEIDRIIRHCDPLYLFIRSGRCQRISPELSHTIGLFISGSAHVYSMDSDGGRTLLRTMLTGANSGTLYAMLDFEDTLIEVEATEDCELLLITPESILETDLELAPLQHKLTVNLINSQRELFFAFSEHIACLSQHTIRGKILRLLKSFRDQTGSDSFAIPMSREEMSSYLAVDRASLSRSLGELRDEGVIEFSRNRFRILDDTRLL